MGTRLNRLDVLTCTHNLCVEQKYEKEKKSTEKCHFYSPEKGCMLHKRAFVMLNILTGSIFIAGSHLKV